MSHTAREDLDPTSTYFICKSPVLERRVMALKYSETFKISSRAEASVVLKLTQQLSDSLEQYFLNCKGLENSTASNYGNRKLDLESTVAKPRTDLEPTLSAYTSTNAYFFDSFNEEIEVTSREKQTSKVISSRQDAFLRSSSDVYGPFQVEQNSGHSSNVSQISSNNGKAVKAKSEPKPHVVSSDLEIKTQCDFGMENNESDFDISSLHSSSSQETPSSSQGQKKTSKNLSPDILQLLKGKDANTVTNILKTLSPFYPALQDVNIEILAQVLVNTGALD